MSTKYIGLVLRAHRKKAQQRQEDIGKRLHVSAPAISRIESGEGKIAFHEIEDYLAAYGLSSECYPVFVKLLYPDEWENILRTKEAFGEDRMALDKKVEALINIGQFS